MIRKKILLPRPAGSRMAALAGNRRGITFWEILLSMTLLLIGMVAILSIMAQSAVYARRMDIQYLAGNIAQERIATLRAMDFSSLHGAQEANVLVDMAGNIDPNGEFLRTTIVTVNFNGDPKLMHVEVQITRQHIAMGGAAAGFGATPSVVMQTVISPYS